MSLKVYDFRCTSCGETFEAFVESTTPTKVCPYCGSHRTRICASAPKLWYYKMGVDPDFTTAANKWKTMRTSQNRDKGE